MTCDCSRRLADLLTGFATVRPWLTRPPPPVYFAAQSGTLYGGHFCRVG